LRASRPRFAARFGEKGFGLDLQLPPGESQTPDRRESPVMPTVSCIPVHGFHSRRCITSTTSFGTICLRYRSVEETVGINNADHRIRCGNEHNAYPSDIGTY
jgi:hypothetical protein